MESPGAVGRRRGTSRSNVEDQALDQIAKEVSPSIYSSFLSNTNLPIFALFSIRHRAQTEWYAAKRLQLEKNVLDFVKAKNRAHGR